MTVGSPALHATASTMNGYELVSPAHRLLEPEVELKDVLGRSCCGAAC